MNNQPKGIKLKSEVVIRGCQDYNLDSVYAAIKDGLGFIGSMQEFVKKGQRVLIKPNMLVGQTPERAVNTHPCVVEAVVKLVIEAEGIPFIGDSPMFGLATAASKKIGYDRIAEKYKIKIVDFNNPGRYASKSGRAFKNLEIEKSVMEADKIINVAKLKTHTQMYMTLSVKNMFGCVIGREKLKWHYVAGRSYDVFARVLLELYRLTNPALNIIDGIIGMEGLGPLTGDSRKIGVLILGKDGLSVDKVACEVVGAEAKSIPIFKANKELEAGISNLEDIKILGDDITKFKIKDFKFPPPEAEAVNSGSLPDFAKNIIKDLTTSRPIISAKKCKVCKMCIEACPVKAIALKYNRVRIDYESCIRCYCCIEACQYSAIRIKVPFLSRFTK